LAVEGERFWGSGVVPFQQHAFFWRDLHRQVLGDPVRKRILKGKGLTGFAVQPVRPNRRIRRDVYELHIDADQITIPLEAAPQRVRGTEPTRNRTEVYHTRLEIKQGCVCHDGQLRKFSQIRDDGFDKTASQTVFQRIVRKRDEWQHGQ
jgi:hypothetical protein